MATVESSRRSSFGSPAYHITSAPYKPTPQRWDSHPGTSSQSRPLSPPIRQQGCPDQLSVRPGQSTPPALSVPQRASVSQTSELASSSRRQPSLKKNQQHSSSHSIASSLRAIAAKIRFEKDSKDEDATTGPATETTTFRTLQWLQSPASESRHEISMPIKAMRPPVRRAAHSETPTEQHRVVIETPFTEPLIDFPLQNLNKHLQTQEHPTRIEQANSNHRAGFLVRLRQKLNVFGIQSITRGIVSKAGSVNVGNAALPGHSTLLKKRNTTEDLNQVSSVLRDQKPISPRSGTKGTTSPPYDQRKTSNAVIRQPERVDTFQNTYIPRMIKGIFSSETFYRKNSPDAISAALSYTSSQHELKMGVMPRNTPHENATYRIKRSPSAETETFLKIDISVRGGTSYLPSEARRIHTPPLPEVRGDGRLRGFFFDYNAPWGEHSRPVSYTTTVFGRNNLHIRDVCGEEVLGLSSANTSEKTNLSNDSKASKQPKEWYDVQLENLDRNSPYQNPHASVSASVIQRNVTRRRKHRRKSGDGSGQLSVEEFDENIPEHLPTSALCPRHPKYWRIVQGRGSQFRGCWMHGVGEYRKGEVIITNY